MQKSVLYAFAFLSFTVLYSCTVPKYVYSPPTANLLRPEDKGNAKVAVNYSTTAPFVSLDHTKSQGIDIQTTYGISNKIALRADVYLKHEGDEDDAGATFSPDYKNDYRRKGFEISGGWYQLGDKKSKASVQLFIGAGAGKFKLRESIYSINADFYNTPVGEYYHNMNYIKGFFQPSFVLNPTELVSFSFATKFSLISFSNIKTDLPYLDKEPLGNIGKKPSFFSDFVFQTDFGFKGLNGIRFQAQTGIAKLNTTFNSEDPNFNYYTGAKYKYNKLWLALGIGADINKLFGRK